MLSGPKTTDQRLTDAADLAAKAARLVSNNTGDASGPQKSQLEHITALAISAEQATASPEMLGDLANATEELAHEIRKLAISEEADLEKAPAARTVRVLSSGLTLMATSVRGLAGASDYDDYRGKLAEINDPPDA
ncbi:MAG: hypothetical protein AAFR34_00270 [Pseudomonadota bacterium]